MQTSRRAQARMVGVVGAVLFWGLAGCSDDSTPPLGHGDTVHMDVDATTANPAPSGDDEAGADSPFAPLDGPYGAVVDAYAALSACSQCACEAGTFCFGGLPGATLSSCDQTGSAGLEIGCHTLPATCPDAVDGGTSGSDCACLLGTLNASMSCYPVCEKVPSSTGLIVYCPN